MSPFTSAASINSHMIVQWIAMFDLKGIKSTSIDDLEVPGVLIIWMNWNKRNVLPTYSIHFSDDIHVLKYYLTLLWLRGVSEYMIYVLLCMMVGSHRYSASQKSQDNNLHALDSVNQLQTNRETNLDVTVFFSIRRKEWFSFGAMTIDLLWNLLKLHWDH